MSIIRNRVKRHYTTVPTELLMDNDISDKSKLLYMYLASKPDSFSFKYTEIMDELGIKNRITIWRYFKELVDNGWISRQKIQDVKGLFKNGYEFMLHDIKYKNEENELQRKDFYNSINEVHEYRYHTLEVPEIDLEDGYKLDLEVSSLPETSSPKWFLVENKHTPHAYTCRDLFIDKKNTLEREYMVKRYKAEAKFIDFIFLGTDIKHVNLTECDVLNLKKIFNDNYKIYKMIKTLDDWFDKPENIKHLKLVRGKSCRDYFKIREWLEEKVRQDIIKERKKK